MSKPLTGRLHGMDALRAIAMLLGLVLHAAIAYRVHPNPAWPDDAFDSIGFDFLYYWIHAYRMQLFFLIAGFFANFLVLKIGDGNFIRHRFKRIFIPFLASLIVIVPLSFAPFLYYKAVVQQGLAHSEGVSQVTSYFVGWLTLRESNGMVHIWFLYYLLAFYAAMMVAKKVITALWGWAWVQNLCLQFEKLNFSQLWHLLLLVLPLTGILMLFQDISVEAYTGFKPRIPHLSYYGFFFFLGWLLYRQLGALQAINNFTWPFVVIGTFLVLPLMWFHSLPPETLAVRTAWEGIAGRLLGAIQTITLTFGMLGLFLKLFQQESKVLRYISDAAYWLYLAHLPVVAGMQVVLLESPIPGPLRFWIVLGTATTFTLVTYHLFVRYTIIGVVLHGPRGKNLK